MSCLGSLVLMSDTVFLLIKMGRGEIMLWKCTLVGRLFKKSGVCGVAGWIKGILDGEKVGVTDPDHLLTKVGLFPDIGIAQSPLTPSPVMDKLTFL